MKDRELLEMFGMNPEAVEREIAAVEAGDLSAFDFSKVMMGRPMEKEKMDMVSAPVAHSRVVAMQRVTAKHGISRAEFIRRAIDRELLEEAL
jgi:hypothetical protein